MNKLTNTFRKIYKKTGNSGTSGDYQLVGNVGVNGVELDIMKGATSSSNGEIGLVPKPTSGQENYILTGDGLWKNIDTLLSSSDKIDNLNNEITYKIKWKDVRFETDAYGQYNFMSLVDDENSSLLSVHLDGGYGAFIISGNNVRIFKVSQLPLEFASSVELHGYILYATKVYQDR